MFITEVASIFGIVEINFSIISAKCSRQIIQRRNDAAKKPVVNEDDKNSEFVTFTKFIFFFFYIKNYLYIKKIFFTIAFYINWTMFSKCTHNTT